MLIRSLFALIANVSLLLVPVATFSEVIVHYYLLAGVFSQWCFIEKKVILLNKTLMD